MASAPANVRTLGDPRRPDLTCWRYAITALPFGYAHCSTDAQDLSVQRDGLNRRNASAERIYGDHVTRTHRKRPGLREALAACRAGDTLVVTNLDRLARSLPDAQAIADKFTYPAGQLGTSAGRSTTQITP